MSRASLVLWSLVSAVLATALPGHADTAQAPGEKVRIDKLDDLPKHTYTVSGKVVDLVKSPQAISELADRVRADIEADLAKYDIADETTLQRLHTTLMTVDLIKGDHPAALARLETIRKLEDKQAKKLTTGLITEAMIAARREVGESAAPAEYQQAVRRILADRVAGLPWEVVDDEIQADKGRTEMLSENLLMGVIQARMEPVAEQTGELNADQASGLLGIHVTIRDRLPLKQEIVSVYQQAVDAHKTPKADIWPARSVTLSKTQKRTPVLVGVWDSGVDVAVFPDQLFVNPNETIDGTDTDGNGYVDDVHGVAYDMYAERTTGALKPLGDAAERIPQVLTYMKGYMDTLAAVDSAEASALKQHLSTLAPQDVKGFIEDLGLCGGYVHGTHVAGIVAEGNPFVRFLIARHSYDYRTVPLARTVEWAQRDAAKCRDTVDYFKQHGVRVVNMSWGEAQEDAETSLEANGVGKDAQERREIARQVFGIQKRGLYDAMGNAPDILFICAAGNADNDVGFDDYIPSSFSLPNLLTVGAVDQAGEPTSFTSFGATAQVYANGFEVDSFVPGGRRMKLSGTSMASPQAANLAAKLLVMDPKLTPPRVISLMKNGADRKTVGDRSYLLLNPKASLKLLQVRSVTLRSPHDRSGEPTDTLGPA